MLGSNPTATAKVAVVFMWGRKAAAPSAPLFFFCLTYVPSGKNPPEKHQNKNNAIWTL